MCDIWRIRQVREITEEDLVPHLASLRALRVRWIVFTGGEPLMHSDLGSLCRALRREDVRLTLLTTGLLLESFAARVGALFDDVIVSLDGPPVIHDRIRAVRGAYVRLSRGVSALRAARPGMPVHARCTIQKENCTSLGETVRAGRELGLSSLSFLAVDVGSAAFNRTAERTAGLQARVGLGPGDVDALEDEVESLTVEFRKEIDAGFVVEGPDKLRRIVRQFRARLGQARASAPKCNAPWVSAVVEADGSVRPCFFHDSIGNIEEAPLAEILNGERGVTFRAHLDIASSPICRDCVCSLFLESGTQARTP